MIVTNESGRIMQFIMLSEHLPGRNLYTEFINISRINTLYHPQNYYLTEDICNSDVIRFLEDGNSLTPWNGDSL